jgi:hypothetical protein
MRIQRQENHVAHLPNRSTSNRAHVIGEHLGRAGFASHCIHPQPSRKAEDPVRLMSYRRELEDYSSQDRVQSCAD